jgi:hypothetical protein
MGGRGSTSVSNGRAAFFFAHGYLPEQANHLPVDCHNPSCCNPLHIYDGSHTENMADRGADGYRHRRLPPDQEWAIFDRIKAGESQRSIAAALGIDKARVNRIARAARGLPYTQPRRQADAD